MNNENNLTALMQCCLTLMCHCQNGLPHLGRRHKMRFIGSFFAHLIKMNIGIRFHPDLPALGQGGNRGNLAQGSQLGTVQICGRAVFAYWVAKGGCSAKFLAKCSMIESNKGESRACDHGGENSSVRWLEFPIRKGCDQYRVGKISRA